MARRYGRQGIPDDRQSLDATTGVNMVHTRKGQIPGTCGDRIHDRIGGALVHTEYSGQDRKLPRRQYLSCATAAALIMLD